MGRLRAIRHPWYARVPLAIFHTGDIFRRYAIEQLQALGRRARIQVISPSYAGISAAVDAGIAVAVLFKSNMRPQWRSLGVQEGYPELPELGIVLERGRGKSESSTGSSSTSSRVSARLERAAQVLGFFFGTQRFAVSAISPTSSYMIAAATMAVM